MTQPAAAVPRRLVVIGTGLIGTSVALAARGLGAAVWLADLDPAAARFAAGLGAGDELPQAGPAGLPISPCSRCRLRPSPPRSPPRRNAAWRAATRMWRA